MSETIKDIAIEHIAVQSHSYGARMRVLQTVTDLAHMLLYDWPDDPGPKHLKARQDCIAALEGKISPGVARISFLEAAQEDGVWTMAPHRPEHVPGYVPPKWKKRLNPWRRGRR